MYPSTMMSAIPTVCVRTTRHDLRRWVAIPCDAPFARMPIVSVAISLTLVGTGREGSVRIASHPGTIVD
jgi:hypothetical protein